ncbi:hypothetical protein ACJX0J_016102, partial [Zea mays]
QKQSTFPNNFYMAFFVAIGDSGKTFLRGASLFLSSSKFSLLAFSTSKFSCLSSISSLNLSILFLIRFDNRRELSIFYLPVKQPVLGFVSHITLYFSMGGSPITARRNIKFESELAIFVQIAPVLLVLMNCWVRVYIFWHVYSEPVFNFHAYEEFKSYH